MATIDSGKSWNRQTSGATWKKEKSGTSRNLWAVQFLDAQHGSAVGEAGTILRYTAGASKG